MRDDLVSRLKNVAENHGLMYDDLDTVNEAADRIEALEAELVRTQRNRDMWKGQCERQAEQLTALRR